MKKNGKRFLCLFLAVLMCCAVLPPKAHAAQNGNYKMVALTFDDGPSPYTGKLLDALKARGAHATFFMVGDRLANYSDYRKYAKRMADEGHQLGNHSWSHAELTNYGYSKVSQELSSTRKYLVEAGGDKTYYVRPPYGSYNSTVKSAAAAPLIMWSVDPLDWQYRNANTVYNNVMNQVRDGSIVLMHDLYSTSVDAAIRVMDTLISRGYELVTVEELLRRRGITPKAGEVYNSAPNKGINLGHEIMDPEYYDESKLSQHWAYNSIQQVLEKHIFSGLGDGKFGPNMKMTRGMFATVLANYCHGTSTGTASFTDVSPTKYYAEPIAWAEEQGLISGYGNGKMGPNDPLTREQAALILSKYLAGLGLEATPGALAYTDAGRVSPWAQEAVSVCTQLGVFSGYPDGSFGPKNTLTRAEAAVLMLGVDARVLAIPQEEPPAGQSEE